MLLFGAIYSLLFWVWVYVLHQKITHGPEYEVATPSQTTPESLLEAASRLVDASGYSLTTAKEEDQAKPSEGQA